MTGWRGKPEQQTREELQTIAEDWRRTLTDFDDIIWPVFRDYGYTKDAALMVTFGFLTDIERGVTLWGSKNGLRTGRS